MSYATTVVVALKASPPRPGSILERLWRKDLDLGVPYSCCSLEEECDLGCAHTDLILTDAVKLCSCEKVIDTPVFLLVQDTQNEADFISLGAADVIHDMTDARLLRRRIDNLLRRMDLERQLKALAPRLRRKSIRRPSLEPNAISVQEETKDRKTIVAEGLVSDVLQKAVCRSSVILANPVREMLDGESAQTPETQNGGTEQETPARADSGFSHAGSRGFGAEDAKENEDRVTEDDRFEDNALGLGELTSRMSASTHSSGSSDASESTGSGHGPDHPQAELDFLRRRSVKLHYQLSLHKAEAQRLHHTERMMQEFRSDLGKVSDFLREYEKQSVTRSRPATSESHHLYNTMREIQRVVAKQCRTFGDVEVDTSTKKWLDTTFFTQETGIDLEEQQVAGADTLCANDDEEFKCEDSEDHKSGSAHSSDCGAKSSGRGSHGEAQNSSIEHRGDAALHGDASERTVNAGNASSQPLAKPGALGQAVYSANGRLSPLASPLSPLSPNLAKAGLSVGPLQTDAEAAGANAPRHMSPTNANTETHRLSIHTCSMRWTNVFRSAALEVQRGPIDLHSEDGGGFDDSPRRRFPLAKQHVETVIRCEEEWDVWHLSELQMMADAFEMLNQYGLTETLGVKQTAFRSFFTSIASSYRAKNPYHNLFHGFDVMKTTFFLLEVCGLGQGIPDLSGVSVLLAAFGHDVGHPGLNNVFQIKAGTDLALRYNDCSVLENYHSAIVFRCIRKGRDEMYGNLGAAGRREMRKIIVETILATDVSKHVKMLKVVNEGKADHLLQLKLVLCVADVSNPIKPARIADIWSSRIVEEFFQQGDEERRRRMEISPYCDRQQGKNPKVTLNFIDFIVNPAMEAAKQVFPAHGANMQILIDVLGDEMARLKRTAKEVACSGDATAETGHAPLRSARSPPPVHVNHARGGKLPPLKSTSPLGPDHRKRRELQKRLEAAYGQAMPSPKMS